MTTPDFPTSIGTSTPETITLLGHDLAEDLLGQIGFGELSYWLVTGQRPTPGQLAVFEAVLVSLADHGFTPTALAARLTLYSAPDSLQGALASGLLGGGSRFLGVTENTGAFLQTVLHSLPDTSDWQEEEWDSAAEHAIRKTVAEGGHIPGIGHPVHKVSDPRVDVLLKIARDAGVAGPATSLFEAVGRAHPRVLKRTLPLNGAGVAGALLIDAGVPHRMLRGVALLARAGGLLGQLREEMERPIGPDLYKMVDRNAVYVASPGPSRKDL